MKLLVTVAAVCWVSAAAAIPEAEVVLKAEFENFGHTAGLKPVALPDSSDGVAMALGDERTGATAGVELQPGDYSLLFLAYAPAGNQDAWFVEIDGRRTRLKGVIGRWATVVHGFKVEKAGVVTLRVIGQEVGMAIDQIAVVRGRHEPGRIEMADVPGDTAGDRVGLADLPRLTSSCALKELPDAPFVKDEHTVYLESFDGEVAGVVGDHSQVEGRFGRALYLKMPDGRFDIDATKLAIGPRGTIEYWVRPRPGQRLWHDQGWHYFLHCQPADPTGFQLDLSRHPRTRLRLSASRGGGPYDKGGEPREHVTVNTYGLDLETWHHLLVSWDLTGEKQYLWLLVDGQGIQSFFERSYDPDVSFRSIEIGNTPSVWDVPYLSIDGAIDELRITATSVAERLAE